jgi:hypothetical protein
MKRLDYRFPNMKDLVITSFKIEGLKKQFTLVSSESAVHLTTSLNGCLFLWLLLLLKQTTENKCLVMEETWFISWGTHHVLRFERRSANSSFMLLLFASIHNKLLTYYSLMCTVSIVMIGKENVLEMKQMNMVYSGQCLLFFL